jgi:hypothetical protein
MRVAKIISGGQTGADRGGLDAAIALGIPHGGWCPRGRLAEDGVIPDIYQMSETEAEDSAVRTERNVTDSDGTVLITFGPPTGGSLLTAELAEQHDKPLLHLDLARLDLVGAASHLRAWLSQHDVQVLNVAGSRESKDPGLHAITKALVVAVLSAER